MNLISKILLPDNILLDTESTSKKRVFERVGLLFENNQQIARSQVFDSLFAREKLGSTGLGQGVAIPHGRIAKLRDATAAYFSVFTNATSEVTWSGVSALIGLMCGALGSPPLVRTASVFAEPAILGAMGGFPCP